MRDDCPDQCHAEGTLCGQRSSSRTLSTVSMRVKEEVSPAKESANLDVDNLQPTASIPGTRTTDEPRSHCPVYTCRACISYTTRSSMNQSPFGSTTGVAFFAFGGSGTARFYRKRSYELKVSILREIVLVSSPRAHAAAT